MPGPLTPAQIAERGDGIWTALAGLDGPQAFAVLVSALGTVLTQAPHGQRAMLRTLTMRAFKVADGWDKESV